MRGRTASVSFGGAAAIACAVAAGAAHAGPVTLTFFYTTDVGGEDVWKTTATYTGNGTNGNGTFGVAAGTGIAAVPLADGLVFNPNNNFLLVGGQGNSIFQVNPSNGSFTTAAPGMTAFELTVDPNKQVVWSGGAEVGDPHISSTPINPFGAAGTPVVVSGSVSTITHITFAPNLPTGTAYYTSAAGISGNSAHFGTINLATGVTTDILTGAGTGALWHGMVLDPFSGDLILAGGNEVVQINPLTDAIISTLLLPAGLNLDLGAVDGQGHILWADNNGVLLFIDYSTTGLVGSANNFVSDNFFQSNIDDIAPLIGAGAPTPEPASMSLLVAGLAGMWLLRRGRRRA